MDLAKFMKFVNERVKFSTVQREFNLPYHVSHINLDSETDPSAILNKSPLSLTIVSDKLSYNKPDRIFPINQDENSVFSQHVYADTVKHRDKYQRVADIGTGSGVLALAMAKAGAGEVIASDVNPRAQEFVEKNCKINGLNVQFVKSNLFKSLSGKFDKIVIDLPFMPAPGNVFPLHAQGGETGYEKAIRPFFSECWEHMNEGGCIQAALQSFGNENRDTAIDLIEEFIPKGWSYEIRHFFPIKDVPIDLYTTAFAGHDDYKKWKQGIWKKNLDYMRFFMITIRNDGKNGLIWEDVSRPRLYNILYPPTTLQYLKKPELKPRILEEPVSEDDYPMIGHLMRLSRYNYHVYLTLNSLFRD